MSRSVMREKIALILEEVKRRGKAVRFGDLLRAGFHSDIVKSAVEKYGAKYALDNEGYTIITFIRRA